MKPLSIASRIWVLLLFFSPDLSAQFQEEIDSLLIIVTSAPDDTNKVKIYQDLSWNYAGTRSETALARLYADSMRLLSEKLGHEKGVMKSHLCYGVVDRHEGNYTQALEHFDKYVNFFKETGNLKLEAAGWYQIGTVQQELGNFDKSMAAYEYILKIHEKNENWNSVVATLNGIGIIYKKIGNYDQAIRNYQKAVAVNDSFNLGRDLTYIKFNIGNSFAEQEQYEEALNAFQESLKIATEFDNQHGISANLYANGWILNMMKKHEQALDYHQEALRLREQLPQKRDVAISMMEVGHTYGKLMQYSLAEEKLKQGLMLAKEIGTKLYIRNAYDYLSQLYISSKDYVKAYESKELYHALNDSIFSEEKVKQINELQTKYETAEKDQQIALLAKEKEVEQKEAQRQAAIKKASFGGIGLIALLAGLLVYTLYQRLKNQKIVASKNDEVKEANFKRQLTELEMKALQAQINPHFIFNCMNSINQMILENDNQNASKYLTKFSKLIRLVLENAEEPEVSLKDELAMLEAYIQLEALRFNGEIKYQIKIKENIDPENTYMPSMVLQPFVENAIWHGLMPKKDAGDGLISITIKQDQDQLLCLIEDNGVGREKALELQQKSVWKSKSLGLKITEERLKLLSQELQKQLIRITDLKDTVGRALGTRVEVSIPNA
ncbi:MAG: tetratricopeptide repeat protein [Cyclobacteriaceae bacterium]